MVELSTIGGGKRPSREQRNRLVGKQGIGFGLGPLTPDLTPTKNFDLSALDTGLPEVLEQIASDVKAYGEKEQVRRKIQEEVNLKMEDRSNSKISLQLWREHKLEVDNLIQTYATQDMSEKDVINKYDADINGILQSYQIKFKEKGGTDRGFDVYNEKIFAYSNTQQDAGLVRQRSDELTVIKNERTTQLNGMNQPEVIDKTFGANPAAMLPSLLEQAESIAERVNIGMSLEEKLITTRMALDAVQNTAFDFYMRRQDWDGMETLFVDTRFDPINGFDGEKTLRKRWQEAKNSKVITVYNTKTQQVESVLESEQKPWQVDPTSVTSTQKLTTIRNQIRQNATLPPKEQVSRLEIFAINGIELTDEKKSTIQLEYEDNKLLAFKLAGGDKELEKKILAELDDKTTANAVPTTADEKALQKGVDKTLELQGETTAALGIKGDPKIPQEVKDEMFPLERLPAKVMSQNRLVLGSFLQGSPSGVDGKMVFRDPIQAKIFAWVLPRSEVLLQENPAMGVAVANQKALAEYAKEFGVDPILANAFSAAAADQRKRRNARQYAPPLAGPTTGKESQQMLMQELADLDEIKGRIDPAKAVGFGSMYRNFLAKIPGQIWEEAVDEETIIARFALLRVSREVMTLVMKNDRFAIAEQNVIVKLLEGPTALTSGRVIKAQLLRFKLEIERGIINAELDIEKGLNRAANLEKIIDYTRIASMLDEFILNPPLVETTAKDILDITDKQVFTDLERAITSADMKKFSPEQFEAIREMQKRMDLKMGLATKKFPKQPKKGTDTEQGPPGGEGDANISLPLQNSLNAVNDLGVLQGFSKTKSAELKGIENKLAQEGLSDKDRATLEDEYIKVKRLLLNIEHNIKTFDERTKIQVNE
jgi:hypothetical protein